LIFLKSRKLQHRSYILTSDCLWIKSWSLERDCWREIDAVMNHPETGNWEYFLVIKLKIAWCPSYLYSQWTACHFLSFCPFGFWFKWQRRPYWESDGNPFLSYNMDKELWYFLVRCKYQDLSGLFSKDHDQVESWQSTIHNCTRHK
jgi:hypothetical protein